MPGDYDAFGAHVRGLGEKGPPLPPQRGRWPAWLALVGLMTCVCGPLVLYGFLVLHPGTWFTYAESKPSPSGRYQIDLVVTAGLRDRFGAVLRDVATGEEEVFAGWARSDRWLSDVLWLDDDRLQIWYREQDDIEFGRRQEVFGIPIKWVPTPDRTR